MDTEKGKERHVDVAVVVTEYHSAQQRALLAALAKERVKTTRQADKPDTSVRAAIAQGAAAALYRDNSHDAVLRAGGLLAGLDGDEERAGNPGQPLRRPGAPPPPRRRMAVAGGETRPGRRMQQQPPPGRRMMQQQPPPGRRLQQPPPGRRMQPRRPAPAPSQQGAQAQLRRLPRPGPDPARLPQPIARRPQPGAAPAAPAEKEDGAPAGFSWADISPQQYAYGAIAAGPAVLGLASAMHRIANLTTHSQNVRKLKVKMDEYKGQANKEGQGEESADKGDQKVSEAKKAFDEFRKGLDKTMKDHQQTLDKKTARELELARVKEQLKNDFSRSFDATITDYLNKLQSKYQADISGEIDALKVRVEGADDDDEELIQSKDEIRALLTERERFLKETQRTISENNGVESKLATDLLNNFTTDSITKPIQMVKTSVLQQYSEQLSNLLKRLTADERQFADNYSLVQQKHNRRLEKKQKNMQKATERDQMIKDAQLLTDQYALKRREYHNELTQLRQTIDTTLRNSDLEENLIQKFDLRLERNSQMIDRIFQEARLPSFDIQRHGTVVDYQANTLESARTLLDKNSEFVKEQLEQVQKEINAQVKLVAERQAKELEETQLQKEYADRAEVYKQEMETKIQGQTSLIINQIDQKITDLGQSKDALLARCNQVKNRQELLLHLRSSIEKAYSSKVDDLEQLKGKKLTYVQPGENRPLHMDMITYFTQITDQTNQSIQIRSGFVTTAIDANPYFHVAQTLHDLELSSKSLQEQEDARKQQIAAQISARLQASQNFQTEITKLISTLTPECSESSCARAINIMGMRGLPNSLIQIVRRCENNRPSEVNSQRQQLLTDLRAAEAGINARIKDLQERQSSKENTVDLVSNDLQLDAQKVILEGRHKTVIRNLGLCAEAHSALATEYTTEMGKIKTRYDDLMSNVDDAMASINPHNKMYDAYSIVHNSILGLQSRPFHYSKSLGDKWKQKEEPEVSNNVIRDAVSDYNKVFEEQKADIEGYHKHWGQFVDENGKVTLRDVISDLYACSQKAFQARSLFQEVEDEKAKLKNDCDLPTYISLVSEAESLLQRLQAFKSHDCENWNNPQLFVGEIESIDEKLRAAEAAERAIRSADEIATSKIRTEQDRIREDGENNKARRERDRKIKDARTKATDAYDNSKIKYEAMREAVGGIDEVLQEHNQAVANSNVGSNMDQSTMNILTAYQYIVEKKIDLKAVSNPEQKEDVQSSVSNTDKVNELTASKTTADELQGLHLAPEELSTVEAYAGYERELAALVQKMVDLTDLVIRGCETLRRNTEAITNYSSQERENQRNRLAYQRRCVEWYKDEYIQSQVTECIKKLNLSKTEDLQTMNPPYIITESAEGMFKVENTDACSKVCDLNASYCNTVDQDAPQIIKEYWETHIRDRKIDPNIADWVKKVLLYPSEVSSKCQVELLRLQVDASEANGRVEIEKDRRAKDALTELEKKNQEYLGRLREALVQLKEALRLRGLDNQTFLSVGVIRNELRERVNAKMQELRMLYGKQSNYSLDIAPTHNSNYGEQKLRCEDECKELIASVVTFTDDMIELQEHAKFSKKDPHDVIYKKNLKPLSVEALTGHTPDGVGTILSSLTECKEQFNKVCTKVQSLYTRAYGTAKGLWLQLIQQTDDPGLNRLNIELATEFAQVWNTEEENQNVAVAKILNAFVDAYQKYSNDTKRNNPNLDLLVKIVYDERVDRYTNASLEEQVKHLVDQFNIFVEQTRGHTPLIKDADAYSRKQVWDHRNKQEQLFKDVNIDLARGYIESYYLRDVDPKEGDSSAVGPLLKDLFPVDPEDAHQNAKEYLRDRYKQVYDIMEPLKTLVRLAYPKCLTKSLWRGNEREMQYKISANAKLDEDTVYVRFWGALYSWVRDKAFDEILAAHNISVVPLPTLDPKAPTKTLTYEVAAGIDERRAKETKFKFDLDMVQRVTLFYLNKLEPAMDELYRDLQTWDNSFDPISAPTDVKLIARQYSGSSFHENLSRTDLWNLISKRLTSILAKCDEVDKIKKLRLSYLSPTQRPSHLRLKDALAIIDKTREWCRKDLQEKFTNINEFEHVLTKYEELIDESATRWKTGSVIANQIMMYAQRQINNIECPYVLAGALNITAGACKTCGEQICPVSMSADLVLLADCIDKILAQLKPPAGIGLEYVHQCLDFPHKDQEPYTRIIQSIRDFVDGKMLVAFGLVKGMLPLVQGENGGTFISINLGAQNEMILTGPCHVNIYQDAAHFNFQLEMSIDWTNIRTQIGTILKEYKTKLITSEDWEHEPDPIADRGANDRWWNSNKDVIRFLVHNRESPEDDNDTIHRRFYTERCQLMMFDENTGRLIIRPDKPQKKPDLLKQYDTLVRTPKDSMRTTFARYAYHAPFNLVRVVLKILKLVVGEKVEHEATIADEIHMHMRDMKLFDRFKLLYAYHKLQKELKRQRTQITAVGQDKCVHYEGNEIVDLHNTYAASIGGFILYDNLVRTTFPGASSTDAKKEKVVESWWSTEVKATIATFVLPYLNKPEDTIPAHNHAGEMLAVHIMQKAGCYKNWARRLAQKLFEKLQLFYRYYSKVCPDNKFPFEDAYDGKGATHKQMYMDMKTLHDAIIGLVGDEGGISILFETTVRIKDNLDEIFPGGSDIPTGLPEKDLNAVKGSFRAYLFNTDEEADAIDIRRLPLYNRFAKLCRRALNELGYFYTQDDSYPSPPRVLLSSIVHYILLLYNFLPVVIQYDASAESADDTEPMEIDYDVALAYADKLNEENVKKLWQQLQMERKKYMEDASYDNLQIRELTRDLYDQVEIIRNQQGVIDHQQGVINQQAARISFLEAQIQHFMDRQFIVTPHVTQNNQNMDPEALHAIMFGRVNEQLLPQNVHRWWMTGSRFCDAYFGIDGRGDLPDLEPLLVRYDSRRWAHQFPQLLVHSPTGTAVHCVYGIGSCTLQAFTSSVQKRGNMPMFFKLAHGCAADDSPTTIYDQRRITTNQELVNDACACVRDSLGAQNDANVNAILNWLTENSRIDYYGIPQSPYELLHKYNSNGDYRLPGLFIVCVRLVKMFLSARDVVLRCAFVLEEMSLTALQFYLEGFLGSSDPNESNAGGRFDWRFQDFRTVVAGTNGSGPTLQQVMNHLENSQFYNQVTDDMMREAENTYRLFADVVNVQFQAKEILVTLNASDFHLNQDDRSILTDVSFVSAVVNFIKEIYGAVWASLVARDGQQKISHTAKLHAYLAQCMTLTIPTQDNDNVVYIPYNITSSEFRQLFDEAASKQGFEDLMCAAFSLVPTTDPNQTFSASTANCYAQVQCQHMLHNEMLKICELYTKPNSPSRFNLTPEGVRYLQSYRYTSNPHTLQWNPHPRNPTNRFVGKRVCVNNVLDNNCLSPGDLYPFNFYESDSKRALYDGRYKTKRYIHDQNLSNDQYLVDQFYGYQVKAKHEANLMEAKLETNMDASPQPHSPPQPLAQQLFEQEQQQLWEQREQSYQQQGSPELQLVLYLNHKEYLNAMSKNAIFTEKEANPRLDPELLIWKQTYVQVNDQVKTQTMVPIDNHQPTLSAQDKNEIFHRLWSQNQLLVPEALQDELKWQIKIADARGHALNNHQFPLELVRILNSKEYFNAIQKAIIYHTVQQKPDNAYQIIWNHVGLAYPALAQQIGHLNGKNDLTVQNKNEIFDQYIWPRYVSNNALAKQQISTSQDVDVIIVQWRQQQQRPNYQ